MSGVLPLASLREPPLPAAGVFCCHSVSTEPSVFLEVESAFSTAHRATLYQSAGFRSETAIPRILPSLSREMMDWLIAFLAELFRFGAGLSMGGDGGACNMAGGAGDGFVMLFRLHPSDGWAV